MAIGRGRRARTLPEVQVHLFDPFFATKAQAIGLGLAIAPAHKGRPPGREPPRRRGLHPDPARNQVLRRPDDDPMTTTNDDTGEGRSPGRTGRSPAASSGLWEAIGRRPPSASASVADVCSRRSAISTSRPEGESMSLMDDKGGHATLSRACSTDDARPLAMTNLAHEARGDGGSHVCQRQEDPATSD